ncbi:MAG: GlsB/YeaQ/YmgE family stress response membrane protein [Planktomarina sp.]
MGLGLIGSIIVGGLAGWIASNFMNAKTGIIANILLGIFGALVLNVLLQFAGIYAAEAWTPQLIVGAAGACMLIWAGRKIRT